MTTALLALALCAADPYASTGEDGVIRGIVVNASQGDRPAAEVTVMLRLQVQGQFVPVGETVTDARGRFRFEGLPIGPEYVYQPGANRGEAHYPGSRIVLSPYLRELDVKLAIHDTVTHPNPLVATRHEIRIEPEPGMLRVTESILVNNPTQSTFVGRPASPDMAPVTLQLAIPSDFERCTFHKEFFGRRFQLVDGKLVTAIPWTPGETELKFTYLLHNTKRFREWRRPLDLPCSDLRVYVPGEQPDEVRCSLGQGTRAATGELVFTSRGGLPPGEVVRIAFGRLPVPWTNYARWVALAVLVGLVAATSLILLPRRRRENRAVAPPRTENAPAARPGRAERSKRHAGRRGRKQSVSRS